MKEATLTTAAAPQESEPTRAFLAMIIVLTFVMNTIGRGVTESFAVFLLPVEKGLAVSRSEITLTYSVYMLVHGLAAPFAGQLIDRFGGRVTYGVGIAALGLGYALAGSATKVWHYYLTVGALGGIGASCLGMVVASSLMTRWFTTRMGSIMSLPYAAVGAGMLVIPPLSQLLIDQLEWRLAHRVLGVGLLALIPIVTTLPLGRISAGSPAWRAARVGGGAMSAAGSPWPLARAVRTGAFWSLFAAYFFTSVAAYSVLPHSVAYLVELGFDPLAAAGAFGMTGVLSAAGVVFIGVLSDRIGRLKAVSLSYVFTMLGTASLVLVALQPSLLLVYGFVLFFGLMQGARGPIIIALIAKLFRGGQVGSIFGALSLGLGTGAATGSWVSGLLHDLTGGYLLSFLIAMAGSAAGMATFWLAPSLRREQITKEPPLASRGVSAP